MSERQGICQRSGFKYPASELVRDWNGLLVHRRFKDVRNPQDFLRASRETPPPRYVAPEPADEFTFGGQSLSKKNAFQLLTDKAGNVLTAREVQL